MSTCGKFFSIVVNDIDLLLYVLLLFVKPGHWILTFTEMKINFVIVFKNSFVCVRISSFTTHGPHLAEEPRGDIRSRWLITSGIPRPRE